MQNNEQQYQSLSCIEAQSFNQQISSSKVQRSFLYKSPPRIQLARDIQLFSPLKSINLDYQNQFNKISRNNYNNECAQKQIAGCPVQILNDLMDSTRKKCHNPHCTSNRFYYQQIEEALKRNILYKQFEQFQGVYYKHRQKYQQLSKKIIRIKLTTNKCQTQAQKPLTTVKNGKRYLNIQKRQDRSWKDIEKNPSNYSYKDHISSSHKDPASNQCKDHANNQYKDSASNQYKHQINNRVIQKELSIIDRIIQSTNTQSKSKNTDYTYAVINLCNGKNSKEGQRQRYPQISLVQSRIYQTPTKNYRPVSRNDQRSIQNSKKGISLAKHKTGIKSTQLKLYQSNDRAISQKTFMLRIKNPLKRINSKKNMKRPMIDCSGLQKKLVQLKRSSQKSNRLTQLVSNQKLSTKQKMCTQFIK